MIGYLDIETAFDGRITVVGLLRADTGLVQLVGDGVTPEAVDDALSGVDTICTYHGEAFDLPVLGRSCGTDLLASYRSLDLVTECRRRRLRGGLKAVEERLGIPRAWRGLTGYDALLLWQRWEAGEAAALETLLGYNRDDVINLELLERRLHGDLTTPDPRPERVVGV